MASSVMSGRVRVVPPPSIPPTGSRVSKEGGEEDGIRCRRRRRRCTVLFSVVPASLPSGTITVHEASGPGIGSEVDEGEEGDVGGYNLRRIHHIRGGGDGAGGSGRGMGGEDIVDHCWTTVRIGGGDDDDVFDSDNGGQHVPVLAALTRRGSSVEELGGVHFRSAAPSCVHLYAPTDEGKESRRRWRRRPWPDERSKASAKESPEEEEGEGKGEGCTDEEASTLYSYEWKCIRTLRLPSFASAIRAGGDALVVAASTGASVWDLRELLPPSLLASRYGCGGAGAEDGGWRPVSPPVELMKAHGVHAMCVSFPYLVAASGDKIGIWLLDDILEETRRARAAARYGKETIECGVGGEGEGVGVGVGGDDDVAGGGAILLPTAEASVATWAAKLERCSSRVTSIALAPDASVLAASCWDGSAYVLRACPTSTTTSPKRDGDGDGGEPSLSRDWEQIASAAADGGGKIKRPPWEKAASVCADAPFPTFAVLLCPPVSGEEMGLKSTLLAVSTPGSDRVRCFDVDAGTELNALSPSAGEGGGRFADCSRMGGYSDPVKRFVHGMIAVGDAVLWIDGSDVLRRRRRPVVDRVDLLGDPLFLPRDEIWALVARSRSRDDEARLIRWPGNPTWSLRCRWGTESEAAEKAAEDVRDLPLSFLDGKAAAGIIRNARRRVHWRRPGPVARVNDGGGSATMADSSTSSVVISDLYIVFYLSADDVAFAYGRREGRWKELDLSLGLSLNGREGAETFRRRDSAAARSDGVSLIMSRFLAELLVSVPRTTSNGGGGSRVTVAIRIWDLECGGTEPSNVCRRDIPSPASLAAAASGGVDFLRLDGEVQACAVKGSSSVAVVCGGIVVGRERTGMILWKIHKTVGSWDGPGDGHGGSGAEGDVCWLVDLTPFGSSDNATLLGASLVPFPKAAGGSDSEEKNVLAVKIKVSGSIWHCFPSYGLWKPGAEQISCTEYLMKR